jgi:hypothetical protein
MSVCLRTIYCENNYVFDGRCEWSYGGMNLFHIAAFHFIIDFLSSLFVIKYRGHTLSRFNPNTCMKTWLLCDRRRRIWSFLTGNFTIYLVTRVSRLLRWYQTVRNNSILPAKTAGWNTKCPYNSLKKSPLLYNIYLRSTLFLFTMPKQF